MKIRTATANRRIRLAGAAIAALTLMGATACGGTEEVLEATATSTVEQGADEAVETAEETAAQAAGSQSSSQQSNSQPSIQQSSSQQSSQAGSSTGGQVSAQATTQQQPAPAPAAAPQPAPTPAPEPATESAVQGEAEAQDEPAAEQPAEQPAEEPATEQAAPEPADEPAAIAPVIAAEFRFTNPLAVEVAAELLGFEGSSSKGIASVCMVQYNEYGNPIYRNGDPYRVTTPTVEVNGVRYPAVLVQGCAPSTANLGVYTGTWSVEGQRGVNNSIKPYLDIAIRAEDGQVKVFCIDTTAFSARFVERTMADYANRTSLGACPA
jgi:hypothetical protein